MIFSISFHQINIVSARKNRLDENKNTAHVTSVFETYNAAPILLFREKRQIPFNKFKVFTLFKN